jgi:protein-tyrosine-phosphatase
VSGKVTLVEVRLGRRDEHADAIRAAGEMLGAALSLTRSESLRTSVGDVELPERPETWHIEAALLRALRPRHLLFLCVANSARSQLAEGLARRLAPAGMKISSAGSEPTSVRPQAVRVLTEIGVDITNERSKGVDEVEDTVDAVITLCAEEVCPVWLADAWRLHWGLPDPAAVRGTEQEELDAFRGVRDELRRRLTWLLAPQSAD